MISKSQSQLAGSRSRSARTEQKKKLKKEIKVKNIIRKTKRSCNHNVRVCVSVFVCVDCLYKLGKHNKKERQLYLADIRAALSLSSLIALCDVTAQIFLIAAEASAVPEAAAVIILNAFNLVMQRARKRERHTHMHTLTHLVYLVRQEQQQ